MAGPRVAIYARLSQTHGRDETSTGRQIESCLQYSRARHWDVAHILRDVDYSAFRDRIERPSYEELVACIEAGDVDLVVVWKLDRLMRRPSEFERFWLVCERHGVSIASVTEPVDTTTPVGLAIVRMLVTFAGLESTVRSQRLASRFSTEARSGQPVNYGRRVFGYADLHGQVVCSDEADHIREAADRVIAGESCTAIARDFAARGITGSRGKPLTHSGLRNILTNPRLVGDRAYRGTVVASGVYPAILDRPTASEVLRILTATPKGRRTTSLLCGMLTCGLCGLNLHYGTVTRGTRIYRCGGSHGCNGIGISAAHLERWTGRTVAQRIQARWRSPEGSAETLTGEERLRLQRTHATQFRRLHVSYYVDGDISRAEFLSARRHLLHRHAVAERRTDPRRRPLQVPDDVDLLNLVAAWDSLDRAAQRALIDLELSSIVVHPSPTRGGCKFNPARLEPRWVRVGVYVEPEHVA